MLTGHLLSRSQMVLLSEHSLFLTVPSKANILSNVSRWEATFCLYKLRHYVVRSVHVLFNDTISTLDVMFDQRELGWLFMVTCKWLDKMRLWPVWLHQNKGKTMRNFSGKSCSWDSNQICPEGSSSALPTVPNCLVGWWCSD